MDLLSSRPFWPIRDGLPATFPPLLESTSCDVAVIGAGISGAMSASLLAAERLDVVVLDRREAAHGSTAGNTGLVLYELDTMLHRLAARVGPDRAARAYRRCRDAIDVLDRWVRRGGIACAFERKTSLYLAANAGHVSRLRREFEARRAAGLAVEWWPRRRIADESSLPHRAAVLSPQAAQIDAYRLTYGLLQAAEQAGARIHDRTPVTRWKFTRAGVELTTARGARVKARKLVVASGYESDAFLPRRVGRLHSTFACVSEPLPKGEFPGWPARQSLIWDTAEPYLYLRTTGDGRVLLGGYDEPFANAAARDRLLPAKVGALKRRFRQFFPKIPLEVATAWAGTFGVSNDGLPFIGQHPKVPHTWFALGFGGNGTTFSVIAAEIVRAAVLGEADPDAAVFGFDRRSC